MNTRKRTKPWLCRGAALLALLVAGVAWGMTPAGTQIKNLATVTYQDEAGNTYSAQSNEAIVTVAEVYAATIERDVALEAAPGQTVYLPFVLSNTGNATDSYTLTASNVGTGTYGDNQDASSLAIYHDLNGNGQPDPGEPQITGALTVLASQRESVVVAAEVPGTASASQVIAVNLAVSSTHITVDDLSTGNGLDAAEGAVQGVVTVTNGPVLVVTKSATHDTAAHTVTYTVTVKNVGGQTATDVEILDWVPVGTTFSSASASGLLVGNGDTLPAVSGSTTSEATLGKDVDGDGALTTSGFYTVTGTDAALPPNNTVTMSFTVSYSPTSTALDRNGNGQIADDVIANVAYADGTNTPATRSNKVIVPLTSAFGLTFRDTGTNAGAGVNNGGDDDATLDDEQIVDTASAGAFVLFSHVVVNGANGNDTFNITVSNDAGASYVGSGTVPGGAVAFPAGTMFSVWDSTGAVQLTDTNGDGVVDTGPVAPGASYSLVIKAKLPSGASGAGPFVATAKATSAGDPAATPASDTVLEVLTSIAGTAVDIANTATGLGTGTDIHAYSAGNPTQTQTGNVGATVTFDLYVANEAGSPDAYALYAGGSWDGTTLGALHAGWQVIFRHHGIDSDGNGSFDIAATNAAITSTPVLPGGAVMWLKAEVRIPNDPVLALANGNSTVDGNADGDNDYLLFFRAVSSATGASDVVHDAVDVAGLCSVALTPPGQNQIQPGGTVDYLHTLTNAGNKPQTFGLTLGSSQSWAGQLELYTNAGMTTLAPWSTLSGGSTVYALNGSGAAVAVTLGAGPTITLPPGYSLPMKLRVFAPSSATAGLVDTSTVSATDADSDSCGASSVADLSEVITSQVRLYKKAAVDATCACTATSFSEMPSTRVKPDECIVWQLRAVNEGATVARNVTIQDQAPAFTTLEAGRLRYCEHLGCTLAAVTDAADADKGSVSGSNVTFSAGDVAAGDEATGAFCVRVQ